MKKVFFCFLLVFYSIVSYTSFEINSSQEYNDFHYSGSIINLNIHPNKIGASIDGIIKIADDLGLEISVETYDYHLNETHIYSTDLNKLSPKLESGVLPQNKNDFISTEESGTIYQSGKLIQFNKKNVVFYYTLQNYKPDVISTEMIVSSSNESTTLKFCELINALEQGTAYTATYSNLQEETSSKFRSVFQNAEILLICFFMLSFLAVYLTFRELRCISIKKSFGYGTGKIVFEMISKISIACIVAFGLCTIMSVLLLYFYNFLAGLSNFFFTYSLLSLLYTCVLFVFLTLLCTGIIVLIHPIDYINDKLPIKSMLGYAMLGKTILAFIILTTISPLANLFFTSHVYQMTNEQWTVLRQYADLPVYSNRATTPDGFYELGIQYKKLFELENNRGGILFSVTNNLKCPSANLAFSNPSDDYFVNNNTVYLNNNYLKLNPIQDTSGTRIDLSDEYEDSVTVLIPEKYRKYEKELKPDMEALLSDEYYISQEIYLKSIGKAVEKRAARPYEIIYVKNNQYYFTCNPEYAIESFCYVKDPIAFIVNNVNMGGNVYFPAFSMSDFKARLPDETADLQYFKDHIDQSGLQDSVLVSVNSYQAIATKIYKMQSDLTYRLSIFIIYGVLSILLIIIYSSFLCHIHNNVLSIKYIFGYHLLKRCVPIFSYSFLFYLFLLIAAALTLPIDFVTIFGFSIISLLTEIIIIALYEKNNSKNNLLPGKKRI